MRRVAISCVLLLVVGPAAAQETPSEMQQRTACISDAFRLCANAIPDRARIRACLGERHADLSPGCRDVYDASIRAGQ